MITVLEWLEASAARTPDAQAAADERDAVTYEQLLARTQALGTYVARMTSPATPIAILSRKSVDALAALYGIAAVRCYYCVLDERQPAARMGSILSTLKPRFMFADAEHWDQASASAEAAGVPLVPLEKALDTEPDADLLAAIRATALDTDPLYVNFTSGSTGTPKGVLVAHRSVIDFIGFFTELFGLEASDQIGNQAPLDFDVSVKDIYSAIAVGACVHFIPREYFSVPVQLMDYLVERQITVCTWAVSAMCFITIMGGFEYKVPDTIRRVIFSGEIMPVKHLNKWRKYLPGALFVNVYGPTEVTCNCTYYIIDREFEKGDAIPIGRPFPNEKVLLLDENDALISPDMQNENGEICVAGTALALGYLNDPEKTAAAFVRNPLNEAFPETLYRTGDLAYYDERGDLVYVGRKDHQIKHMGQRIELGEIETIVQSLDGITRACCTYDEKKKRLLLYYTGELEKDALTAELHERLPQYMTPNRITQLEDMPLSKNGKIDRMALSSMPAKASEGQTT